MYFEPTKTVKDFYPLGRLLCTHLKGDNENREDGLSKITRVK